MKIKCFKLVITAKKKKILMVEFENSKKKIFILKKTVLVYGAIKLI
jgi:hypothetical protein